MRIRFRASVKQIQLKLVAMEIGIMIAMEWKPTLFYTLFSIPPPRRQKRYIFSCMEQRIVREKNVIYESFSA